MKIILQKPVDKLGVPGDIVEVADGYARNYLVPRGFAVKATKGGERHIDSLQRAHGTRVNNGMYFIHSVIGDQPRIVRVMYLK